MPYLRETPMTNMTMVILLGAIIHVENPGWTIGRGVPGIRGEKGPYHLHKDYVADVNRILGKEVYTWEDAEDLGKATKMVTTYVEHYGGSIRLGHTATCEDYARIHNGGPNGWKKKSTKPYWDKVRVAMRDMERGLEER